MDDITASNPIATTPPIKGNPLTNIIKWFKGPKIIFLVLALVVLVEVIFAARSLKQNPPPPAPKVAKAISGGKIILASPKKEYSVGESVPVSIRVSTGGHPTDGTDVVLSFDSKVLSATSSAIITGKIYPDYPVARVEGDTIRISGISSVNGEGFNGSGVFATINFKAKAAGRAGLVISFKPGSTTDSNIVESKSAKDDLEGVTNIDLTVK
jgi:hypothetical protein